MSLADTARLVPDASSRGAIQRVFQGFVVSRAVHVVTALGIPDLLSGGPKSSDELANATATHAPSLYRLLRALVSAGVLALDDAGHFALTPMGAPLQTGVPGSLRAWVLLTLGGEHYRACGDLMHSVRTGETAFDHIFGADIWTYNATHPETARIFDEAMSALRSAQVGAEVLRYPFSPGTKLVDVGGGDGTLAIAVLRANPSMTGVVFDLAHVAEKARRNIAAAGLAERCEAVEGDALRAVPAGGDVYVLCRVIHDWDDPRAAVILGNCRRAMSDRSRLLIIERTLPPRIDGSDGTRGAVLADLLMLVIAGGRERTEAEFRTLCDAAGLQVTQLVPSESYGCIVEAVPRG